MNPLLLMITIGRKDEELFQIIRDLEGFDRFQRSPTEEYILQAAYQRLDIITTPARNR